MRTHHDRYCCATLFRTPEFTREKWVVRRRGISPAFLTLSACAVLLLAGVGALPAAAQQPSTASAPGAAQYGDVLNRYCVTCHNERLKTASLILEKANVANPVADAAVWEKVIGKLRMRAMPPAGMPRPDAAFYGSFVNYLETSLDREAAAHPNPGRPAAHRLNRSEYANAIRDLLAVDASTIDIPSLLPADDSSYGFDNIGDVLTVSPMLMEGYLSASRKISRLAIGDRAARPVFETYEVPRFVMQDDRMSEDLPLGSRGGTALRHHFPLDGEYTLRIHLQRNGKTYIVGLEKPRRMDVRLDGELVKQFTVGGDFQGEAKPLRYSSFDQGDFEKYLMTADEHLELRFPAKAGTRLIQVTFPNITAEPEGVFQPHVTDYAYAMDYGHPDLEPAVGTLTIGGPFDAKGLSDTPSRSRIFVCRPAQASDEEPCARRILSRLARLAFRRPIADADLEELLSFYNTGRSAGDFEEGIQAALQRILVDPEFLFRIERDPAPTGGTAADSVYRLSDLELASRLSFFLWSSIPDSELLDAAEQGKLRSSEALEQHVRRMLADPRSKALVDNFAGQWLYLRNVEKVWPNPDVFPEFDANLREAFRQETGLLFESMLREDRSVLDLLNSDYTFVNERLARHYGIPNIYGSHFRRIPVPDETRRGLLGQGGILTVTSYATRTAPTIRGRWLLENILGTPPPPPPPDVPSLDEKKGTDGKLLTMRQQMEQHRANPVCASCHRVMDPLGFALENFDATGRWRASDGGKPIDSSGVTPDGTPLQGPADLRKFLLAHPEQFVTTATTKLLTYALGRGVEYYDAPAVRRILRDAAPGNYRWSSIILGIAQSTPFQMRRSP
jgi:cytochrome c5